MKLGEVHQRIYTFLQTAYEKRIPALVLAPRGIGKTTALIGFLLWLLVRNPKARVGVISDNEEHGIDRLTNARHYLEGDPDFRWLFPEIRVDYSVRGRRTQTKLRLVQNTYAKDPTLLGVGVTGGGTGTRMDLQAFDDLCTERNTILQPAEMERVKKAFAGTFRACLVPGGWWFYIGTLYHEADLTHALKSNPEIARLVIGLDPENLDHYNAEEFWPGDTEPKLDTIPLWEEVWPKSAYEKAKSEMAVTGDGATKFFAAYCNLIIDPETATFRRSWFEQKFTVRPYKEYVYRVLYADPATATDRKACFYSGVVLGWDAREEKAVVLHAWREREALTQKVDRYLNVAEAFYPHRCGIEGQHEGSFADRIEERAIERSIGLPNGGRLLRLVHGHVDKEARIGALAPLLQYGKILVDLEQFPFFWKEASMFPASKVDALDALEGAFTLIKKWLKSRLYVPRKFPVDAQFAASKVEPHTYRFQRRRGTVPAASRNTADHFFG